MTARTEKLQIPGSLFTFIEDDTLRPRKIMMSSTARNDTVEVQVASRTAPNTASTHEFHELLAALRRGETLPTRHIKKLPLTPKPASTNAACPLPPTAPRRPEHQ